MRALLLIAHGSRVVASNEEVGELVQALALQVADRFEHVAAAFLELAEPSLGAAIDAAVAAGCQQITVLPYFLAAGAHVTQDIPALVRERQALHPQVRIELAAYVGRQPGMVELLANSV